MKDSSFHSASISTVSAFTQTKFAKLKDRISRLKMILDDQNQIQKCDDDEFIIHQQLDESNIYVKLIPKQINKLLESVSDEGIHADEYLQLLRKGSVDQEDLKLQEEYIDMGFDRKRCIKVCLLNDNKFDTVYSQAFINKAAVCQNILNDVINNALKGPNDECYSSDEDELDISLDEPIVFYKNVEYTIWKQRQRKNNLRRRLPKDASSRNSYAGTGMMRGSMPIKVGSLGNESMLLEQQKDRTFAGDQYTMEGKEISIANMQASGMKQMPKFQPSSGIEGMMNYLNQPSEALKSQGYQQDTLNPGKKMAQLKPSDSIFNFDPSKDFIYTGESPQQDLTAAFKPQQQMPQNNQNLFQGQGPTFNQQVRPNDMSAQMMYQAPQMIPQMQFPDQNGFQQFPNQMMMNQQFPNPQQMMMSNVMPNQMGYSQMNQMPQMQQPQMQQPQMQQPLMQQPQMQQPQIQQPQQRTTLMGTPIAPSPPANNTYIPTQNPLPASIQQIRAQAAQSAQIQAQVAEPTQMTLPEESGARIPYMAKGIAPNPPKEEDINEKINRKAQELTTGATKKKIHSRKHSHDSLISQSSRRSSRKGKKKNMKVLNRSLESITKNLDSMDGDSLISSEQSSSIDDNDGSMKSGGSDEVTHPQQTDDKKSSKLLNTASLRAKGRSEENQQIRELEYIKKTISDLKRIQEPIIEEDTTEEQQQFIREGFQIKTINLRRTPLEKISEVDSSSSIASVAQGLFQGRFTQERYNQLYGENEDLRMSTVTASEMHDQRSVFGERHESDKALNKYVPAKNLANQSALMKMYQSSSEDQQFKPRGQLNAFAKTFVPKQKKFGVPPGYENFTMNSTRTSSMQSSLTTNAIPFQPGMGSMPFIQAPIMQLPLTAGNLAQMQQSNPLAGFEQFRESTAKLSNAAPEFNPKAKKASGKQAEEQAKQAEAQNKQISTPPAQPIQPVAAAKPQIAVIEQKPAPAPVAVKKEEEKKPIEAKPAVVEQKEEKKLEEVKKEVILEKPKEEPAKPVTPAEVKPIVPKIDVASTLIAPQMTVIQSASPQPQPQPQPMSLAQKLHAASTAQPPKLAQPPMAMNLAQLQAHNSNRLMQLKANSMPQKPSPQTLAKYRQNQLAKDDNQNQATQPKTPMLMGMAPGQQIQQVGDKLTTIMYQMPPRAQSPNNSTQLGLSNLVASKPQYQSIQPFNAPTTFAQAPQILSARSTSGGLTSQSFTLGGQQAIPTGSSTGVMYVTPAGGPNKLQMMAQLSNSVVSKPMPSNTPLPYAKSVGGVDQIRAGSTPAPPSAALLAAYKKKKEEAAKKAAAEQADGGRLVGRKNSTQSLMSMNSDSKSLKAGDKGYGFQKISIPRVQGRQYGKLKFFDEDKRYGFLLAESDHSDIFVHYDDLKKANVSGDILKQSKTNYMLTFSFNIMSYYGKYKYSKKAVDVKLEKCEPMGLVKQGGVNEQSSMVSPPVPRALSQKSPPQPASLPMKHPFNADQSTTSIDQSKI